MKSDSHTKISCDLHGRDHKNRNMLQLTAAAIITPFYDDNGHMPHRSEHFNQIRMFACMYERAGISKWDFDSVSRLVTYGSSVLRWASHAEQGSSIKAKLPSKDSTAVISQNSDE